MPRPSRREAGAANALAALLGLAVFCYLLAYPPVLGRSDESVVLYGAKRILQGQAIYRDFFEFITPGSFYFFAAVFALAGATVQSAHAVMAAVNGIAAGLLFVLARRVASALEATLVTAVFAALCLPLWPYASPHWLSTALSLAAAVVSLGAAAESPGRWRAAAAGALAGLTFAVQQNRGVVLGLWVVAAIVIRSVLPRREGRTRWLGAVVAATLAGIAAIVPILGYSVWKASAHDVVASIFTFVLGSYYAAHAGSTPWAGAAWVTGEAHATWLPLLRTFPAVLAVEAVLLGWTLRTRRGAAEAERACLLLLAAVMSAAILYYPDFIHVAFIAPFVLVIEARLVFALRSRLRGMRWVAPLPATLVALAVVAAGCKGWMNLRGAQDVARERFPTAFGTLAGQGPERRLVERVREILGTDGAESKPLFVYPAEAWLYLAVPADNPTRYSLLLLRYNPPEHFREALARLDAADVEHVVVNASWLRAGDPVLAWLEGRYVPVAGVGPVGGIFTIYGRVHR